MESKSINLCRGKRKSDGKWVEGNYLHLNVGRDFLCDGTVWIGTLNPCKEEVKPETVGRFTGLYTVAEQRIWEGDIVQCNERKYVVQRECETPGGYWAETGYILKEIGVCEYISFVDTIDEYYNEICVQIIGNIHDNPELLEVSHV